MLNLQDLEIERYEVRDDSDHETWDYVQDNSGNLALYHFWIDENEEYLYCRAALVGFDYTSDDDYLVVTDDFKAIISGSRELESNPASLYWPHDGEPLKLKLISISYYANRFEYLSENPPRYADRVESSSEKFESYSEDD